MLRSLLRQRGDVHTWTCRMHCTQHTARRTSATSAPPPARVKSDAATPSIQPTACHGAQKGTCASGTAHRSQPSGIPPAVAKHTRKAEPPWP
eukprot:CAMPEP_0115840946 /NCGR_PEP_ID=MMETSP0287-20121206/7034_1 /TAXON_ID=412157 /ORGANISM="Chrysochromulina rotalis, Strain UIO044" /LENGTH=91 /DNA_ID=CAMNT_0003294575 /DNA_START=223 /DNA_END=498 /DNA_ORIENTATION=-